MTEEWRPVVGYEGIYEVSSIGRVRSVDRAIVQDPGRWGSPVKKNLKGKILSLASNPACHGALFAHMYKDGVMKNVPVSRMVAEAFIGPCPEGMTDCCHNDGDNNNNTPDNLRWDTRAGNLADMHKHGTVMRGEKNPSSNLNEFQVRVIKRVLSSDNRRGVGRFLGSIFGLDEKHVSLIKRGACWGWVKV